MCCLHETHLIDRNKHWLRVKGWKKIYRVNGPQNQPEEAIFISDKVDFKLILVNWDKGGHFIQTKVAMWLMLLHRHLQTYDYWSTTHNSQAMQTTKIPQYWWIKKMWYLYTMEFHSVTKNDILSFTGKWLELESIILSKVCQGQKDKNCMYSLIFRL
jgi:hypothetical protein